MAEKKKRMRRKDKPGADGDYEMLKDEKTIAKFLRLKCPCKETTLMGDQVQYFQGSKAVDLLVDSRWGSKAKKDPIFSNRQDCVDFLDRLLQKRCFYRAKKLVQRQRQRDAAGSGDDKKEKRKEKEEEKEKRKEKEEEKKEEKENEDEEKEDGKKKKRKVKLLPHDDQVFLDTTDVYVWIFEATSTWNYVIGSLIVFGSIGLCMFPLWPAQLRAGVYYVSMSAVGFICVLLVLVVVRTILFGLIWLGTKGEHHFWLLPNLTEDCGFFESFKPLYTHKIKKKRDQKKDDDAPDEGQGKGEKGNDSSGKDAEETSDTGGEGGISEKENKSGSEGGPLTEDDDVDNFEIVDKEK